MEPREKSETDEREQNGDAAPEEAISLWLAGAIILALIAVFALAGLIIKSLYLDQPPVRTAIERDIYKYKELSRKNPTDISARLGLADAYIAAADYGSAEKVLGEAMKLDDKRPEIHERLAEVKRARGNAEAAISEYRKAIALDPKNELANYNLGQIYLDRADYRNAAAAFKNALAANPTLADAHYKLGLAHEKLGERSAAASEYREALKYIPDYSEAKEALARVSK